MRRMIHTLIALGVVAGLSPVSAQAQAQAGASCTWTYHGCTCGAFGACAGVNCDNGGTGMCVKNET